MAIENADTAKLNTLTVGEEASADGRMQYVIAIDGQPLEVLLSRNAASGNFNGLYPSLGMNDPADQRRAAELMAKKDGWTPLLVCGDDMDLSCSVVSAYVQETDGRVRWSRFGWGVDGSEEITVPALCFNKAEYDRFVDDYLQFAARPLPAGELWEPAPESNFIVKLVQWIIALAAGACLGFWYFRR